MVSAALVGGLLGSSAAASASSGVMGRIGVGLTSPLIVDFNGFGMEWDERGGSYWGVDFSGISIIIALAQDRDAIGEPVEGHGWSVHLMRGRGGGYWGVTDWFHVGVGVNSEWGAVTRPSQPTRGEGFISLGLEVPLVFAFGDSLWMALVPRFDWMPNYSADRFDGWRFVTEALVTWRAVGPLSLYGSVGFQHIGNGFEGNGTAPVYQVGVGLDIAWFYRR